MTVATDGLIARLLAQEAGYTATRAGVIGRWPGNPFGVAVRREAAVFACRVAGVPSPWLNRVMGLGEEQAALVPSLRAWFGAVAPRFETTPDSFGPGLGRALVAAGLAPVGGDALVWGPGQGGVVPDGVSLVEDAAALEDFLETHLVGLELPEAVHEGAKSNMRGWLGAPGFALLLAREGGEAAGACALHRQDGQTYVADMSTRPAFRGRGVQTRLLAAAHALHGEGGIVWARCRFLSQSHRNLQRAGLQTLCTTMFWR